MILVAIELVHDVAIDLPSMSHQERLLRNGDLWISKCYYVLKNFASAYDETMRSRWRGHVNGSEIESTRQSKPCPSISMSFGLYCQNSINLLTLRDMLISYYEALTRRMTQ